MRRATTAAAGVLAVGALLMGPGRSAAHGQPVTAGRTVAPTEHATGADTLTMREIARGDQSNIDGLREVVVRRAAEWQTLWREHNFEQALPRVDFAREMIVAVFVGSQTSAGYSVRIADVRPVGDAIVVRYQVSRPAAGAVAAQVLTFPYHIVAVPVRPGNVRFERNLP